MKTVLSFLVFLGVFHFSDAAIRHLELGAANYSPRLGSSPEKFRYLEEVVADLVEVFGPSGVIYLNDMDEDGLELASSHLSAWLQARGLTKIEVRSLAGNYFEIDFEPVTTANLSNPGINQLLGFMPTDAMSPARRKEKFQKNRDSLERLASVSETGLTIISYYREAVEALMKTAQSVRVESTGAYGYHYAMPDGRQVTRFGRPQIYRMIPIKKCESKLNR